MKRHHNMFMKKTALKILMDAYWKQHERSESTQTFHLDIDYLPQAQLYSSMTWSRQQILQSDSSHHGHTFMVPSKTSDV